MSKEFMSERLTLAVKFNVVPSSGVDSMLEASGAFLEDLDFRGVGSRFGFGEATCGLASRFRNSS
ncbi:MAG: hypothetical protein QM796_20640 [Chthoniobacteraceae bacterium]